MGALAGILVSESTSPVRAEWKSPASKMLVHNCWSDNTSICKSSLQSRQSCASNVLPVARMMKSQLLKGDACAQAAVCNFSRQVGYLAIGIGAILVAVTLYHFVNARFM